MRDETKKKEEMLDVSVEAGALLATGLSVKLAKHDEKVCVGCSEFIVHFITDNKSTFRFSMNGPEFKAFYEAQGKVLEQLAEAVAKGESEPHA